MGLHQEKTQFSLDVAFAEAELPRLKPHGGSLSVIRQAYLEKFLDHFDMRATGSTNSLIRWGESLQGTKRDQTVVTYLSQTFSALRIFLFERYALPSPEFDDIAALLIGGEICRSADERRKDGTFSKNEIRQFSSILKSAGSLLADDNGAKRNGERNRATISKLLPAFSMHRSDGKLKMSLRAASPERLRPEIRESDEVLINYILKRVENDSPRQFWSHFFKPEVIGGVLCSSRDSHGNKPKTINLRRAALTKLERFLESTGELGAARPVMPQVDRAREPLQQRQVFTPEEMTKMLRELASDARSARGGDGWKSIRDFGLFAFLDSTLLRAGALCQIRVSSIDKRKKVVFVPEEKGGKSRILPLHDLALEALDKLLPSREAFLRDRGISPKENDSLFLSRFGTQYGPRAFDDLVHSTAIGSGIGTPSSGRWGPHTWRHSMAAWLYKETNDIIFVQRLLGHAHPTTTLLYVSSALDEMNIEKHRIYHPRANGLNNGTKSGSKRSEADTLAIRWLQLQGRIKS